MPKYRYRGEHAVDIENADGSVMYIGDGDEVELTAKEWEASEYKDVLLPITASKGGDET